MQALNLFMELSTYCGNNTARTGAYEPYEPWGDHQPAVSPFFLWREII